MSIKMEVLSVIGAGSLSTADEIKVRLQNQGILRDIRSIQRTLKGLAESGVVDCDDSSKPFGYKRSKGAQTLAMSTLKPAEAMVLLLVQKYLDNVLPASLRKIFDPYFSEARVLIANEESNSKLHKQWLEKIQMAPATQPLIPPKIDRNVLDEVSAALYSNLELDIQYKSTNGKVAEHRLQPLGIVQQGVRLYLVAKKAKYEKPVPWAIHRISKASQTSFTFTRPSGFNLKNFQDDATINWGKGQKVMVSFWMHKNPGINLIETPLSKDQTSIAEDDGYRFTATVTDSLLLTRWIQSFGKQVKDFEKHPV